VSKTNNPSAAASLLIASRKKSGASGSALMKAMGESPLVAQGNRLKPQCAVKATPSDQPEAESRPAPVVVTAVGQTRSALQSIAELGKIVRKARKAMKMNQAEFAAHAGVGRRFVSELESGKPSLEFNKVLACAAAAGIDLVVKGRHL